MEAELESRVQEIGLIPFSQYTPSLSVSENNIPVLADWIRDMPTSHDEYRASENAHAGVLFTAVNPVKDFRLLAIQLQDVDKDGNAIFSKEKVYQQNILTPEQPLVAYLDFFGDIPNNGIAFVDEKGNTRYFAVSISGEDGSLQLIEFWE